MKIELNDNQVTILKQLLVGKWSEIDNDLKKSCASPKTYLVDFLYRESEKTAFEIKNMLDQITADEESEPIKIQNSKMEHLVNVIIKNPDLPVIPFVDSEIISEDGYGRWMGSIGYVGIEEYCFYDGRYYFKENIEDLIDHLLNHWKFKGYDEEYAKKDAEKMDWRKAICVYIDLPEV